MNGPQSQHVPVMCDEVVHWLAVQPGSTVVDGTVGGGGHTRLLADAVGPSGLILGLERDPAAVEAAENSLRGLPIKLAQASYCDLPEVMEEIGVQTVDGVLLDLGLSSDQLADPTRGFSFDSSGPLDLRFDPTEGEPAWKLINRLQADKLANLIYEFGEERYSRRIARAICEQRRQQPIQSAAQLAELVRRCLPKRKPERIDPATRTFQALRIAVNDELKSLETVLRKVPECLRAGGRLAVISFHSLEDRRVKEAFRDDERYRVLTRRPIRPSEAEVAANPRARSAKLRVAEKVLSE